MNMQNAVDEQHTLVATEKGLEPLRLVIARNQCEQRIQQAYPTWQQLNILRAGTKEEQARMGQFIDACRAWSNGELPDLAELEKIKP
ncbi:hypothetical protein NK214_06285 [Chromobacterium sp. S0633]|uniref:hypothetical protein n=1 Tax=Chromobacterium sp. S0633 TaxID=2957805 RepID=UPI00209EB425|nr:hypothetical protein [Chromobacterium sp. S0633]MCP1289796.1 hypothetical protein [Chromobacterium sp. S0633]